MPTEPAPWIKPEAVEALEYLYRLTAQYAPEGVLNASSGEHARTIPQRQRWRPSGGLLWSSPVLQDSGLNWEFVNGTAPEGKTPVGTYGGWNLVMYKDSPHKEAVWKFIEFMTDPAGEWSCGGPGPRQQAKRLKNFLEENRKSAPNELWNI